MLIPLFFSLALNTLAPNASAAAAPECRNSQDALAHHRGVHALKVSGPVVQQDWLIFSVKVELLTCQERSPGEWSFAPASVFEPVVTTAADAAITVHTKDVFLKLSHAGEFLTALAWEPGSRMVAVGLRDVMSDDVLEKFNQGAEVSLSLDFELEKDLLIETKNDSAVATRSSFAHTNHALTIRRD